MLFDLKKGTLDVEIRAQFGIFVFDWLTENFTGTCIWKAYHTISLQKTASQIASDILQNSLNLSYLENSAIP